MLWYCWGLCMCANVFFLHILYYGLHLYYMWLFILFGKLDKRQKIRTIHQRHRQLMASCKCYNTSAVQSHSQNRFICCFSIMFGGLFWLDLLARMQFFCDIRLLSYLLSHSVLWNQGAKTTESTITIFHKFFVRFIGSSQQILQLIFQHRCKFCIRFLFSFLVWEKQQTNE